MKKKKTLLFVIIIIAILAVSGSVFGYLYMATDVFKSNQELFGKYMTQNIEAFQKLSNGQISKIYKNLENEENYEANSKITMIHSEGGEVSNPLNELSLQLDIQKNSVDQYIYADAQILYGGEEYLEAEIIKEEELYGIRFTDVVKQFVTIKNDENLENVANDLGIESKQLIELMDMIDGTQEISDLVVSEENENQLKEKYLNIVSDAISKGTFSSLKDAMITYNNNTINTNAYTVKLTSSQVKDMIVQILNNLKEETTILEEFIAKEDVEEQIDEAIKNISEEAEIPEIKITIYEQKQQTVRTVVEIDTLKMLIENEVVNEGVTAKIQISDLSAEEVLEYNIEISNVEGFDIITEILEGENTYTISFLNDMEIEEEQVLLNSSIIYEEDILKIGGTLETNIKIGEDFEKKEILEASNKVVLNDLQSERRILIINQLKEKVPEKVMIRLGLLFEALGLQEEESDNETIEENQDENSQVEINKFNAKFEFYTGETVSAENVRTLLDIVKNNLAGCEITTLEEQDDIKYTIKLNIEKDKINEEEIYQVLEKINDENKYRVSIVYKVDSGLIDYIMINEING